MYLVRYTVGISEMELQTTIVADSQAEAWDEAVSALTQKYGQSWDIKSVTPVLADE